MRHYEIVVMTTSEQRNRSGMADRFKDIVTESGGKVHRFEDWGVRQLAYPINKQSRACYFLYNIECEQEALNTLKESFRFSESVIRSLIVRCEEAITTDSHILLDKIKREQEISKNNAPVASDKEAKNNSTEDKK